MSQLLYVCDMCGFSSTDDSLFEERDGMWLCPGCSETWDWEHES